MSPWSHALISSSFKSTGFLWWISLNLLSASSVEKDFKSGSKINKTELSKVVAEKLAKKAQEKKITKVFFDRGVYKYHGRVKVFAETLRKNGMEF